jgi:excisionase family DNA binding protein
MPKILGPYERVVLTVEQAGALLGLSRGSAYLAARRGQLPTLKFGSRLVVPVAALEKLLASVEPGQGQAADGHGDA